VAEFFVVNILVTAAVTTTSSSGSSFHTTAIYIISLFCFVLVFSLGRLTQFLHNFSIALQYVTLFLWETCVQLT
jgi:hypothetical protein